MLRRRRKLVLVVSAVAIGSLAAVAYAAIPGANGVIQGCYDNGGNLRVVASVPCPKGFTALSWNQQGPRGTPGTPGAPGTTGQPGTSVTSAAEAPGANCTYGGSKFVSASGTTYACNGAPGTTAQGVITTYRREWNPSGDELGSDQELTSGETVSTTLSCNSPQDQLTGFDIEGDAYFGSGSASGGQLATQATPVKGNGTTTPDGVVFSILNNTFNTPFILPGTGWIICAVGN